MCDEVGYGILDFIEFKEKKDFLEKRIVEVSCMVEYFKQEVFGFINGMLILQRDLNIFIDKIIGYFGLDEEIVQCYRMRLIFIDLNDI